MLSVPQVPAKPLAAFRAIIGLVAAVKACEFIAMSLLGAAPDATRGFLPTTFPRAAWTLLGAIMLISSILMVLGLKARIAALTTGVLTFAFIWGAGYYGNHTYLLATLATMLSFTDSGAAISIRSRRGLDREYVWGPPVYLLRAQISIVYFYAAVGKLNFDFLSGNALASWGFHSLMAPHSLMVMPVLVPMAVGAVCTELFIAVSLWVRRLRPVAITLGTILHLSMIAYISESPVAAVELSLFAAMMIGGYLLFVDRLPVFSVLPVLLARIFRARFSGLARKFVGG
jgi:hypothetical protein